jgi:HEAT repeat protein
MVNYSELFKSLNSKMVEDFENKMSNLTPENEKQFMSNMDNELNKINLKLDKWSDEKNVFLENKTPNEYFSNLNDKEIFEIFIIFSKETELNLPKFFKTKLKSEYCINKLIEYSTNNENLDNEDIYLLQIESIRTLGILESKESIKPLIEFMQTLSNEHENIMDIISESLAKIGTDCIEPLLLILESRSNINLCNEYMLNTLAKIGKNNKDDRIYKLLRNIFRNTSKKTFVTLLLGDYGDGRAIPLLKGYVAKNNDIDNELLYEIKYVVEKLGGKL